MKGILILTHHRHERYKYHRIGYRFGLENQHNSETLYLHHSAFYHFFEYLNIHYLGNNGRERAKALADQNLDDEIDIRDILQSYSCLYAMNFYRLMLDELEAQIG